jgi:hypothetical protein
MYQQMLYFAARMPVVFVIASDWKLRTSLRAELIDAGIQALGMDSPDQVGRALAAGEAPAAIILEATSTVASDAAICKLVERVPTVVIASRTETVELPRVTAVLYRPVRIGDVVKQTQACCSAHITLSRSPISMPQGLDLRFANAEIFRLQ